jgi:hypothetical protein
MTNGDQHSFYLRTICNRLKKQHREVSINTKTNKKNLLRRRRNRMTRQSDIVCHASRSWQSSACSPPALCVPLSADTREGRCRCNFDTNNYTENDHGTCDPTALTWIVLALLLVMILLTCGITYRICKYTWRAHQNRALRMNELGLTTFMLIGSSVSLLFLFCTRVSVLLTNTDPKFQHLQRITAAAQGTLALFFISALSLICSSLLVVVIQSAKMDARAGRYRRNIFIIAVTNGFMLAVVIAYLTYTRNFYIFALVLSAHTLLSWAVFHYVLTALKKSFESFSASNQSMVIINSSAKHILFGLLLLAFSSVFILVTVRVGVVERSQLFLSKLGTGAVLLDQFSFVVLLDAMVRCIERLGRSRQIAVSLPTSTNITGDTLVADPAPFSPNQSLVKQQTEEQVLEPNPRVTVTTANKPTNSPILNLGHAAVIFPIMIAKSNSATNDEMGDLISRDDLDDEVAAVQL